MEPTSATLTEGGDLHLVNATSEAKSNPTAWLAVLPEADPMSYFEWRWRRASNRTTPAATETLSDFTGPVVGSETTKSQRLRSRADISNGRSKLNGLDIFSLIQYDK
jgi:hypothetical protein